MNGLERIQLMHMSRQLLQVELDEISARFDMDPISPITVDDEAIENESYYLQFPSVMREQASEMAAYYQIFYCLENSIRDLVESQLEEGFGEEWWESKCPDNIKATVTNNKKREQDNGVSLRSSHLIDYTTFGELNEIIKANWDIFGATFNSRRGLEKVMASLNLLRGPVAHCSPLADDEVVRLHLAVRDFYRLME